MATAENHAVNTWPWSSQMFRKWIPRLQAALSCDAIRVECCAKRLISDAQKKELMAIKDSAKHNGRLLDMLSRGTAETFHTFCTIVRSTEPKANFSKFLDDMQSVDTFVAGNEGAANRVTRSQPTRFTGNPPPSPSQATRSPPAIAPKPKPVVKPQATHTSPAKPTGVSAMIAALNSAGQEGKSAGSLPLKPIRAPRPPTRPKPVTPHNTARAVETKDPTTGHRVQPVVTSDPVSPPRPPLCDHARLAAGGNQPDGTEAATSAPADPKPSPKPGQAAPSRSASVSTLASSFESNRHETVRLPSDQAPKPKHRQMSIAGARAASLARSPAIAGGKHPGGHAVQQVQRSALPTESLTAKPIARSLTGREPVTKKATGDSATPPQPNSLSQAGNTGPWSSQVFREWIPRLQATLSCSTIRMECRGKGLISDTQKKELMTVDDSAKHNELLLDMLSRGTAETFHTFCSIVRSTEPEANFSKFLDDMQSVDTFVAVSPECQKDCNKVVDLMKEFSAPERQRVVHTAEDVARMRASQTVLDKRKKPIHLPQPTSPVNVDLLSMRNMGQEQRRAVLTEIDRLASSASITDDREAQECQYQGQVTRADGQVDISPADIHRELSKHPCFISIGTESARDSRSISETKQYLKDTGFIDDHTVVTETTGYLEVLVNVPVNILAIRGSKRLKFTDESSSIVKFIIDCEYNHTVPSFIERVVRNLRNLLGDESVHADGVHSESGGTAVFVQMSAKAHTRLWEFCKDQSSLLAGLHILEVSTVDGAVVFNLRPTACSDEGINPDDQKRLVEEFCGRFPSLDQDELSVAVADQPDVEHAVIALTKLVFDEGEACLNALPEILGAARKATSTSAHVDHPEEAISTHVSANSEHAVEIQGADNELSLQPQLQSQWSFRGSLPDSWRYSDSRRTMYNGHAYIVCREEEGAMIYRSTHSLKESLQVAWTRAITIDNPHFRSWRNFCIHNEKMYFASISDGYTCIPKIHVVDLQGNCGTREIQCDCIPVQDTSMNTSVKPFANVFITQSALLIVCFWRNHFLEVISLDTRHDDAVWAKLDPLSMPEPPDSICSTDSTLFVIPTGDLNDAHLSIMKLDVSEESLRMPSWLEIKVDVPKALDVEVDLFHCDVPAAVGNTIMLPMLYGDDDKLVNGVICVDCTTCIGRCSVLPLPSSTSCTTLTLQLMVDGDTLIELHYDHSVYTLQLPDHL
ncbi:uncharacterized protein LOC135819652 isoform X2 [Sycon ciliatum]|uniref:uncharacterized protein LOC135819652 isoform X2 n=1 Tax=Sycon ciliatum TaxID=27933 RepID=UPI0031F69B4C